MGVCVRKRVQLIMTDIVNNVARDIYVPYAVHAARFLPLQFTFISLGKAISEICFLFQGKSSGK